jgi:hypothetical protein
MNEEDLLVRMAVQVRPVARLDVDQDQRQPRAVFLALELARGVASRELVRVDEEIYCDGVMLAGVLQPGRDAVDRPQDRLKMRCATGIAGRQAPQLTQ